MKPFQTLLFIFSIFVLLFFMAWIFPERGIQAGKHVHLKFASLNDFLEEDTVQYADISEILKNTQVPLSDQATDSIIALIAVSSENEVITEVTEETLANADSLRKVSYAFEYSGEYPTALYPFFRKLRILKSQKKLVRILHYGDSQIEDDRMSSFIRYKLQTYFGGSGCGTFPVVPLYNGHLSISQEYSDNWERFTGFPNTDTTIDHNRFGALFSFARQKNADTSAVNSWLKISPSSKAYSTSRVYSDVALFVQPEYQPMQLRVLKNNSLIDSVVLQPNGVLRKLKWKFGETPEELKFEFSGHGIASVYGVSADNSWGVALDNIPLRGSSGLVFSKTDTAFLSQMYDLMDVGLIILQFGGNVVPYMTENFNSYERYFKRELSVIRRIRPGVPVIVIGPSDMSVKDKDNFITYPNLEGVRDAIRRATLESGFVYWDMYEAMGGRNSMPSWVNAKPSLATSDYVHFNSRGAKIIAEMFWNALLSEYEFWLVRSQSVKK